MARLNPAVPPNKQMEMTAKYTASDLQPSAAIAERTRVKLGIHLSM